jgi:hypothetical protein
MTEAAMGTCFDVAPWPTALKVISGLGTVGVAVATFMAYRAFLTPSTAPRAVAQGIVFVFPAIAVIALLFMVTGYDVAETELYVRRPLWATRVALSGLTRVWHDPTGCRGALRIFGNGGLYSFTGLYQSHSLGRFRLFGTDLRRAVVLDLGRRVVVVTPAEPHGFVGYLGQLFPGALVEGERDRVLHGAGPGGRRAAGLGQKEA